LKYKNNNICSKPDLFTRYCSQIHRVSIAYPYSVCC